MKYSSEQINSTGILNRLVDISAIAGVTLIVLFTMEIAARETTGNDVRQALFAILAIAVLAAIKIFTNVIQSNNEVYRELSNQDIGSIVNLYGGTYNHGRNVDINSSVESRTQVPDNSDLEVPENYFDVVRTIEQVPISDIVGIREVLVRIHSYIETEPNLSVEQRKIALDKVKEIATQAISDPDDVELQAMTSFMTGINNRSEIWSQVITTFITPINIPILKLILSVANLKP
jgi:hypothetical protein